MEASLLWPHRMLLRDLGASVELLASLAPASAADTWEAQVEWRSRYEWNASVYLVVADFNWHKAFDNLFATARHLMRLLPVVVATDDETAMYFADRGVPVARYRGFSGALGPMDDEFDLIRYSMTCRFLRRGLRVLYADVDVFFVQSPFYHDMQATDVVFAAAAYGDYVENSLYLAKPTVAAAVLFDTVVSWSIVRLNRRSTLGLQYVLDYAVRHVEDRRDNGVSRATYPEAHLAELRRPVLWSRLPLRRFMHYTPPRGPQTPGHFKCLGDVTDVPPVSLHLWGQAGTPDARVLLACQLGYWVSATPPPRMDPEVELGCRWMSHGWRRTPQYDWCRRR